MLTFDKSLAGYETRLRSRFGARVHGEDIVLKHEKMRKSAFLFLRATCWRWAEAAPELVPELMTAPVAGCVGDAHVGNFGLWHDAEFRLVWGANDFDEAALLPYPLDLIRLCASAMLAESAGDASESAEEALDAYRDALGRPEPVVLDDANGWIRESAEADADDRRTFWKKLRNLESTRPAPEDYETALKRALPADASGIRIVARAAGAGSLGRPRFAAIGAFRGGPVAAEVKGVMASCWSARARPISRNRVARGRFRSPDPSLRYGSSFSVRRLGPNNRKLDFDEIEPGLRRRLVVAMARDLAAIHADTADVAQVRADLSTRGGGWLGIAARRVAEWTAEEFERYRAS